MPKPGLYSTITRRRALIYLDYATALDLITGRKVLMGLEDCCIASIYHDHPGNRLVLIVEGQGLESIGIDQSLPTLDVEINIVTDRTIIQGRQ